MIRLVALAFAVQAAPPSPPAVVTVAPPAEVAIVAGGRAEAQVVVTIREGFHIQANPASEPYLIPARLELAGDPRVRVGKSVYPPGRPYRLRGASSDLSTYEGTFVIGVPLEASKPPRSTAGAVTTEPTSLVLEGALHYQACDDRVCLRPSSVPVRLPLRIEPRPAKAKGR